MKFLRKLVNRGAPKGVPFLLLLMVIGVLAMARARPVDAEEKTYRVYSYNDLNCSGSTRKGTFKKDVANYVAKNKASFDYSNSKIYVRGGGSIDLKETLGKSKDAPFRYYIWIKYGKHQSSGCTDR